MSSNRSFGFLLTVTLVCLSSYRAYFGADRPDVYGLLIAATFVCLITLAAPNLLAPFNMAWIKLGDLLGMIVNPLVLGVLFFLLITPVAVVCRYFGRDELHLKRTKANTYWIDRAPPIPEENSFKNQF